MLTLSASVDRTSLMHTIGALAAQGKAQGLTVRFVCLDVMRSWILKAIKVTPPWSKGGKPGNSKAQQRTGEAAVAFDLFGGSVFQGKRTVGVFGVLEPGSIKRTFDDRLSGHPIIVLKNGAMFGVDRALYRPDAGVGTMRAHHLKFRGKNGHVSSAGASDRRIGRWKFIDKMFVNKPLVEGYKESVQNRVGSLKAGWLPALHHYAYMCNGSTGRLPQWIKRNVGAGSFGGIMDQTGNGTLYAENTAHHSGGIRKDAMIFARNQAEKEMRRFASVRLQRLADQFNRGQRARPIMISEETT